MRSCNRSRLEPVQPHPLIGLERARLLHVELVFVAAARQRRGAPQRGALTKLFAEGFGGPNLTGLDDRLHPRRAQNRRAPDDELAQVGFALAGLHFAVVQGA